MIAKIMAGFDGYKTNILMIINGCIGIYMAFNPEWTMPGWMAMIDASLVGGAVRSAMKKGPGA